MERPTKPSWMTIDCETTGLDWTTERLHGIGIGYEEGEAEYYPVWDIPDQVRKDLEDPEIAKVGHNLHSFDGKVILRFGIRIAGPFDDVMVLGNLLGEEDLSLKVLAEKHLGVDSLEAKRDLDRYVTEHKAGHVGGLCAKDLLDPDHPHLEVIARYCREDVINTTGLYLRFIARLQKWDSRLKGSPYFLKKSPIDYYFEEARPIEKVLFAMEYRGIRIDLDAVNRVRKQYQAKADALEAELSGLFQEAIPKVEADLCEVERGKVTTEKAKLRKQPGVGKSKFSWGNNNHVGSLIYKYSGLSEDFVYRTPKGAYKTDKATIERLIGLLPEGHFLIPSLKLFAEYKLQLKILTTYTGDGQKGLLSQIRYINGIPRIFPRYRQTTSTGRLASSGPNMQNLKRKSEVKTFFVPDNPETEVFDDLDYSQIELRVAAHISQEPALVDAYNNGEDLHIQSASDVFQRQITKADDVERQAGKRMNFLTIFDGTEYRLQSSLKADTGLDFSLEDCAEFIKRWFERRKTYRKYLDNQLEFFHKNKFCVTETGRVRLLPDIEARNWVKRVRTPSGVFLKYIGPPEQRSSLEAFVRKTGKEVTEKTVCWAAEARYRHAVKAGYNQPIQGLAASMTKRSMIRLHERRIRLVNQVHDSLVVSRAKQNLEKKRQVIEIMEKTYPLIVPVVADVKTIKNFHPDSKVEE